MKDGDRIEFYQKPYHQKKGYITIGIVTFHNGSPITERGIFCGCDVIYQDRKTGEEDKVFICGGDRDMIVRKL